MRVAPDERDALLAHAARLGVESPLAGPWIRHNWGRCVFWADGCRLHAEVGVLAKPRTCRQFPFVFAGDAVAIDPACFHADPDPSGEAPEAFLERGPAPGPRGPVPAWSALEAGHAVARRLRGLPLAAVIEGPRLGSQARQLLAGLEDAEPAVPDDAAQRVLDGRISTVLRFGLAPAEGLADLLVGGSQLLVGANRPVGAGFAAWVRLLRTGVV